MDNNERAHYITEITNYGYSIEEATRMVENPIGIDEFTKEYFESQAFQATLKSKKYQTEKQKTQPKPIQKPQPIKQPYVDYTRRSIERQVAAKIAFENWRIDESVEDTLLIAEQIYQWIK